MFSVIVMYIPFLLIHPGMKKFLQTRLTQCQIVQHPCEKLSEVEDNND